MAQRQFRFTKKLIEALPPCPAERASKEVEYSDLDVAGLRVVVNRAGRKSFLYRYTFEGRKRATKLGNYPDIDIQAARQAAIECRIQIAKGQDPQATPTLSTPNVLTLDAFWNQHLWPHFQATKRSADADLSRYRNHIQPEFGSEDMRRISALALQQFHNKKKQSHCAATANRIMEVLQRAFNLAVLWGLVDMNPAKSIRLHPELNRRDRYLSAEELPRFMQSLAKEKNRAVADAFLFLLATGTRREEALGAQWAHVDLEKRLWFLPHTKSGKSRYVLLNDVALEILRRRQASRRSEWVFPGTGEGKIGNPTRAWKRVLERAQIDPASFRIHDLRHTHASYLVGVASLHEIAGLLGHSNTNTTQRYAHLNAERLRQASQHVSSLLKGAQQEGQPSSA